MGVARPLILVANPGSASRKYGLYRGGTELAKLHFEWSDGHIVCTAEAGGKVIEEPMPMHTLDDAAPHVMDRLVKLGVIDSQSGKTKPAAIAAIGLRIVAPSTYFLSNRLFDRPTVEHLRDMERVAPLHIGIVLKEYSLLRTAIGGVPIYGISDSAFHAGKPDHAWNYGISLPDADRFDIKRFGYHGLSVASAVRRLKKQGRLAERMIVAHIGSGGSITAVYRGRSVDNTMGYSPLEGIIMATRSGSIDYSAVRALQIRTEMTNAQMEVYLNKKAGLFGLGGSDDIRELLKREKAGDHRAELALATSVYNVQKAIGQMSAAMGGVDVLVFTGTAGERSAVMRQRLIKRLGYLDFQLDDRKNTACTNPDDIEIISQLAKSKPVIIVHADEASEIALQTAALL